MGSIDDELYVPTTQVVWDTKYYCTIDNRYYNEIPPHIVAIRDWRTGELVRIREDNKDECFVSWRSPIALNAVSGSKVYFTRNKYIPPTFEELERKLRSINGFETLEDAVLEAAKAMAPNARDEFEYSATICQEKSSKRFFIKKGTIKKGVKKGQVNIFDCLSHSNFNVRCNEACKRTAVPKAYIHTHGRDGTTDFSATDLYLAYIREIPIYLVTNEGKQRLLGRKPCMKTEYFKKPALYKIEYDESVRPRVPIGVVRLVGTTNKHLGSPDDKHEYIIHLYYMMESDDLLEHIHVVADNALCQYLFDNLTETPPQPL